MSESKALPWRGRPLMTKVLLVQRGQSMAEFSVIIPLFLLLLFAIIGFGLLFANKVALDDAVRSGARWASTHPDAWSNASSAPQDTIQGRVQNSGTIGTTILNNGTNITIQYAPVPSSGNPITCGSYTSAFTPVSPNTEQTCVAAGNMVKVTATINYQLPLPIISNIISIFSRNGVQMQSSATMVLEQSCAC